jgi:hypothetical protein
VESGYCSRVSLFVVINSLNCNEIFSQMTEEVARKTENIFSVMPLPGSQIGYRGTANLLGKNLHFKIQGEGHTTTINISPVLKRGYLATHSSLTKFQLSSVVLICELMPLRVFVSTR